MYGLCIRDVLRSSTPPPHIPPGLSHPLPQLPLRFPKSATCARHSNNLVVSRAKGTPQIEHRSCLCISEENGLTIHPKPRLPQLLTLGASAWLRTYSRPRSGPSSRRFLRASLAFVPLSPNLTQLPNICPGLPTSSTLKSAGVLLPMIPPLPPPSQSHPRPDPEVPGPVFYLFHLRRIISYSSHNHT